jgi:AhpD family alkylhydroperoxidase
MPRLPPPTSVPDGLAGYGLLAHAPEVLRAFLGLYGRLWCDGVVDQATKEVVRLRNARVTGCGYCRNVRFAGAREAGLAEADVAMIDDAYAASALSARRKAAVALTDVVLGRTEAVDDALAAALARDLAPAQVVELAVTAGLCHGFSKVAVAFGPPPDMPVTIVPSPTPPERA